MVEVQDDRIGFAAIDTGVLTQVFEHSAKTLSLINAAVAARRGDVGRAVSLVVAAVPDLVAGSAEAMQQSPDPTLEAELAHIFGLTAAAAAFLTRLVTHAIV